MAQLRHKLEDNPARPRHLLTEPGMGYRLLLDASTHGPGRPDDPPEAIESTVVNL
jgi:hypothetical protein